MTNEQTTQRLYKARDFRVREGLAMGDPLTTCSGVFLDDRYVLSVEAEAQPLAIDPDGALTCPMTAAALIPDGCLTLMGPDGAMLFAAVVVRDDQTDPFLLPLSEIATNTPYRVIAKDHAGAKDAFARMVEDALIEPALLPNVAVLRPVATA